MNILKRSHFSTALLIGSLLLTGSLSLHANELQDATQLFKQGQHSQALSAINNFLSNKPKDAQGRFLKGLILTEQGKINDAIKVFSDLTQDYPELPEPYNNLAVLYASLSQYDRARSALEMAIRTHPSYATAHENLGDIYAKMASQAYDRAFQLDNSNTTTKTKLAMIQDLFSDTPHIKSGTMRNPAAQNAKPVAAAASNTARPPVKTPVEAATPALSDKTVSDAVKAWAGAWASQNVKKYLASYSANFKTPDGESRAAWEKIRQERISKPKHIELDISNIEVDFTDNTHASVTFQQRYRTSNFKASGGKTLLMVKSGSNWLIQEERAH